MYYTYRVFVDSYDSHNTRPDRRFWFLSDADIAHSIANCDDECVYDDGESLTYSGPCVSIPIKHTKRWKQRNRKLLASVKRGYAYSAR